MVVVVWVVMVVVVRTCLHELTVVWRCFCNKGQMSLTKEPLASNALLMPSSWVES